MTELCYLDHHTATRPHSFAIERMVSFFREHWGAMHAPHKGGQDVHAQYKPALDILLDHLGARDEDHFYFCHSGAEAINAVFNSHYFDSVRESGKNHVLTTNIEEAAILSSLKRLEKLGCKEKILSVNPQGQVTKEMLEDQLGPRTSLFSLSWANGLTGVIHPIADLAEACREQGVRIHVDVSTVIGKLFFRFSDLPIDYVTFEGQLIHSPQGTAGLVVKSDVHFSPLITGDHTIFAPGVAALSVAFQENERYFDHLNLETARLRDKLESGICAEISDAVVFFQHVERLPNCCAIGFPGVIGEALLYLLNRKGVYATLGGGQCQTLAHVLIATGIDPVLAQCALSFSLSYETTEAEIDHAINAVVECAQQLQRASVHLFEERT
jgi:cysteine desulfurase